VGGLEDRTKVQLHLRGHFRNFSFSALAVMLRIVKTEIPNGLRGAVRFPLHLHVALHGNEQETEAETLDISAGGVLIHCRVDYPVGSTIQFAICMPAQAIGAEKDVKMECVGRVVRCTPAGDRNAVGVIIDEYRITR